MIILTYFPPQNITQILVPKSGAQSVTEALQQSQKQGQLLIDVLKFCQEYPEISSGSGTKSITALHQMIFNTDLSSGLTIKMSHGSGDQHRISHDELVNITNVTFNAGLLIEVFDTALFQINTKNSLIF